MFFNIQRVFSGTQLCTVNFFQGKLVKNNSLRTHTCLRRQIRFENEAIIIRYLLFIRGTPFISIDQL